ncbi:MAG: hypothetical protein EON58_00675 [Alphaproteobacteria bacterium]|nr:MAG: hypothetical protein EON58_00675 [Alphaproteobacteria bacterium]
MIKSNSVVLVGEMNPSIFSPAWIRQYVDLTVDDGSDAEVQVIHSEISDFMLCDIRFTVERNRLTIRSLAHDVELLVAVVEQIFGEVLSHTPIWAYGVNFERHVDFLSFEKRNELGRLLCPLAPWGEWAKGFDNRDPKLNSGMASVSMKKVISKAPDAYEMFTVQPSNLEEMNSTGVFFQINNHFSQVPGRDFKDPAFRSELLISLRENVSKYVTNFDSVVQHFLTWGGIDE